MFNTSLGYSKVDNNVHHTCNLDYLCCDLIMKNIMHMKTLVVDFTDLKTKI